MPTLSIEGDANELASDQEVVETLESLANGWLVLISSANEELQRKVPQVMGFNLASYFGGPVFPKCWHFSAISSLMSPESIFFRI